VLPVRSTLQRSAPVDVRPPVQRNAVGISTSSWIFKDPPDPVSPFLDAFPPSPHRLSLSAEEGRFSVPCNSNFHSPRQAVPHQRFLLPFLSDSPSLASRSLSQRPRYRFHRHADATIPTPSRPPFSQPLPLPPISPRSRSLAASRPDHIGSRCAPHPPPKIEISRPSLSTHFLASFPPFIMILSQKRPG